MIAAGMGGLLTRGSVSRKDAVVITQVTCQTHLRHFPWVKTSRCQPPWCGHVRTSADQGSFLGVFPGALGPTTATMVRRVPQIFFIFRLGLISRDSCGLGRGRLLKQEMTPICRRISKPLPLHYCSPLRVGEASRRGGSAFDNGPCDPRLKKEGRRKEKSC